MMRIARTAAALVLLGAGLAACDGGGGGGGGGGVVTPPAPPPVAAPFEDQFGTGFGTFFRASANSDPFDPTESSLVGVSFTTDPVPVP